MSRSGEKNTKGITGVDSEFEVFKDETKDNGKSSNETLWFFFFFVSVVPIRPRRVVESSEKNKSDDLLLRE